MNKKLIGVFLILGSAFLWSIEPILVKLSYSTSDFIHTTAIRTFVAALIALAYVLFSKASFKITKKEFSAIAYISLTATLIAELLYVYALSRVPVINAVLIAHTQPVFIAVMAYFTLKEEKLTKYDYLGMFFMIIAGLFVTTKNFQNLLHLKIGTFGDLLVLTTAVLWAITSIVMKKYLSKLDPGTIVFYRYSFASVAFFAYLVLTGSLVVSNIYQILVGAVIGVGMILYYESMKRIKAAQAGALELASPFFAVVTGYLFLQETITLMQFFGIMILLVGVYFLSRKEK
ncbi:MAG TPA: DMT family transporter [Candidatus Nanoarchaeia archaeon]|nr:DMT family transporter [Candidatus Nanoarchaeia archaeon]